MPALGSAALPCAHASPLPRAPDSHHRSDRGPRRQYRWTYPVGALVFHGVMAVELWVIVPAAMAFRSMVPIPVLPSALALLAMYSVMAIRARMLGGMMEMRSSAR